MSEVKDCYKQTMVSQKDFTFFSKKNISRTVNELHY